MPVFLPGEFDGKRSLVGHSPQGCKESDTTEQLITHTNLGWDHLFSSHLGISYIHPTFCLPKEDME